MWGAVRGPSPGARSPNSIWAPGTRSSLPFSISTLLYLLSDGTRMDWACRRWCIDVTAREMNRAGEGRDLRGSTQLVGVCYFTDTGDLNLPGAAWPPLAYRSKCRSRAHCFVINANLWWNMGYKSLFLSGMGNRGFMGLFVYRNEREEWVIGRIVEEKFRDLWINCLVLQVFLRNYIVAISLILFQISIVYIVYMWQNLLSDIVMYSIKSIYIIHIFIKT